MRIVEINHSQTELKQFHQLAMDVNKQPAIGSADSFKQMKKKLFAAEYIDNQCILLAFKDDKPVARLVARVSPTLKDSDGFAYGFIGFFASMDNSLAATSLFEAAIDWFVARDIKTIIGPMADATWFANRLNLGPFERDHYVFEPQNPTYYPTLWEEFGFTCAADYYSRHFDDLAEQVDYLKPHYDNARRQGFHFRTLKPHKMQQEMHLSYEIARQAFHYSAYYSDVKETVFSRQYATIKSWVKKQLFYFVFDKDNKPVGFIYALPDFARLDLAAKISPTKLAKIDTFNVYTVAVLPQYQRRGLGSALSYLCYRNAASLGMTQFNICQIKEGNPVDKINLSGGDVFRRYRLYQYQLK